HFVCQDPGDLGLALTVATYTTEDVLPGNPTLFPGETLNFNATPQRPVTWSSTFKRITSTGVASATYTAPATLSSPQQETVTACAGQDCASTTVSLNPLVVDVFP